LISFEIVSGGAIRMQWEQEEPIGQHTAKGASISFLLVSKLSNSNAITSRARDSLQFGCCINTRKSHHGIAF
jgi:hypothetical protein